MTTAHNIPVVDTFRSEPKTDGITLFQKAEDGTDIPGRMVHLTPDDALGLFHTLLTEMSTFAFPELLITEGKDEDDEPVAVMTCPRCGWSTNAGDDSDAAVSVQDVSIRYTGGHFDGTVEDPELHVWYSGGDFEGFVTTCANCNDPVTVPGHVTEQGG